MEKCENDPEFCLNHINIAEEIQSNYEGPKKSRKTYKSKNLYPEKNEIPKKYQIPTFE